MAGLIVKRTGFSSSWAALNYISSRFKAVGTEIPLSCVLLFASPLAGDRVALWALGADS